MAFFSELLPRVFADQNHSHYVISDMIPFSGCYNVHLEFCQVNDGLDSQDTVFIVGQIFLIYSIHPPQGSMFPRRLIQFGSSLSNKPKKCMPISNPNLQQKVFFFSLGKEH